MPLLAAREYDDPYAVAAVVAAGYVPWIFAVLLGAIVDRLDVAKTMLMVDLGRAALLGGFAVAVVTGNTPLVALCVLALALGFAEIMFDTAAQAAIPAVVPSRDLERANGQLYAGQIVSRHLVGEPLGGLLFAWNRALPFVGDCVTFLASALFLRRLAAGDRGVGLDARRSGSPAGASLLREAADGVRWARQDPLVRPLLASVLVLGLAQGVITGQFVLFCTRILGTSDLGFALLSSAASLGAVAAAALVPRLLGHADRKRQLLLSVYVAGASYIALSFVSTAIAAAVLLCLNAAAVVLWNVLTVSARQRVIPRHLMGRVTAVYRTAAWGSLPIGALISAPLTEIFGLRATPLAAGILVVSCAVLVVRMPRAALQVPVAS